MVFTIKKAKFSYTLCLNPRMRVLQSEFCYVTWAQNTRMTALPERGSMKICTADVTQLWQWTDRHNDTQK